VDHWTAEKAVMSLVVRVGIWCIIRCQRFVRRHADGIVDAIPVHAHRESVKQIATVCF